MTVQHSVLHKFAAGLNASKNTSPLKFDFPGQQDWKVYYEELTAGAIRVDDAYWLVAANGGGAIGAGDSHSIRITPDGTDNSGYSLYRTLADRGLSGQGKKFYMETRVKITLDTGGTVPANGWFVGYTDAAEALLTGAGNLQAFVAEEAIGFGHFDGATSVSFYSREDTVNQAVDLGSFYSREDTVNQAVDLGFDLADGVYVKLACYYDGSSFNLYANDVLISSTAMTSLNVDEGMTPQVFFEADEGKANTFDIQYLLFAAEL